MSEEFKALEWLENPNPALGTTDNILDSCRKGAQSLLSSDSPRTVKAAENLLGMCELLEEAFEQFNEAIADPDSSVTLPFNRLLRAMYLTGAQAQVLETNTNGLDRLLNLAESRLKSNAPLDEKNLDERRYVARGLARIWARNLIEADTGNKLRTKDIVAFLLAAMDGHRDIFELERSGRTKLPPERTIRENWLQDIIAENPYLSRRGRPKQK